jgi:hypothetical protein
LAAAVQVAAKAVAHLSEVVAAVLAVFLLAQSFLLLVR